jgi:putative hemolysin
MGTTLIVLAVLLVLNGVFAMAELAMMMSRASRLQRAAKAGSRGSAAALSLAREPTKFLSTVQVGITLIGILAGAVGQDSLSGPIGEFLGRVFPWLGDYAGTAALVCVVVVLAYFSLVLGELVPKRLAIAYPEAIASAISRPLRVLSVIGAWPVRVLSASTDAVMSLLGVPQRSDDVSEEDVRSLVARAATTGVFTPQEHKLFQQVFRVGDLRVRDLMVPRPEVVWIDKGADTDALKVIIGTNPFSHFPVCDGDLDRLIGVVHIKDVIAHGLIMGEHFDVTSIAQKPHFVPETLPALRLLDLFQSTKMHIAFVVNEFGGTQGLVTLNDVLGALVGDISRRGEEGPPLAVKRDDGSYVVDCRLGLHDFVVTFGLPGEVEQEFADVSTVAGLVLSLLGHIPKPAESVQWQGLRIEVVDMDGTRVDSVIVSRVPSAHDGARGTIS